MKHEQLKEEYLNSVNLYTGQKKKVEKLLLIMSVLRFFTFTGGFIIIWIGFTAGVRTGVILSLILITLFLYLLNLYSKYSRRKDFLSNLIQINQNEAQALSGDLSAFDPGNKYIDIKHDYSYDIDLFGIKSFFQYLNRTVTDFGKDILAGWLSDSYILSGDLLKRQEAIKELASKKKWRQEFMAFGMMTSLGTSEISDLLGWMDESDTLKSETFRNIMIYLLPALSIGSLLLLIFAILPYQVFLSIFLINLLFVSAGLKKTNRIHNSVTRKYNFLSSTNALLSSFEDESFVSPVLNDIKMNIAGKATSASISVKKLSKLIQAFDSRNNMLIGALLNGILLWDFQCIYRLEKWKSECKSLFPVWLHMLGQIDAYISLGNYAYDNPDFVYPFRSTDSGVFSAKNLGHQLIDENKRVCNDFCLGKKGTICIISGANMAGKSTFLRTVAVNFIIGMAGAPVCATEMSFLQCKLFTSMRTMDSLSENESYFYAELRRLNLLKSRIEEKEPVFFVLDEILKGTNSADKTTGSKLFIQRLVERNGTGLLATHDTSLGKMENDHPGVIINKCFEIEIDGENISFDYKIHDGITQKMNAVFLMKQMGILD